MSTTVDLACPTCGATFKKRLCEVVYRNRTAGSPPFYCGRACAGVARRDDRTKAQRVADKAEYDRQYREREAVRLAENKRRWYAENKDREKEREARIKNMPRHVEYCRRYYADPEKKAAKVAYDLERRAADYGPFADAWKLLVQLEREIRRQVPSRYERSRQRGYYERSAQQRRRDVGIARR